MSWFGRNIAGKAAKRAWPAPADQLAAGDARGVHRESNNMSATLVALELLASRLPGILMMDEACGDGKSAFCMAKLAACPKVQVLRTFSESYAKSGTHLDLMFGHGQPIDRMNEVMDSYNVNVLTRGSIARQHCATAPTSQMPLRLAPASSCLFLLQLISCPVR